MLEDHPESWTRVTIDAWFPGGVAEQILLTVGRNPHELVSPDAPQPLSPVPPAPVRAKKAASVAREASDAPESRALTAGDGGDHESSAPPVALSKTPLTPIIDTKNAGDHPSSGPPPPIDPDMLSRAVALRHEEGRLTVPMVKRRLGVPYGEATRIVEAVKI